MERKIYDALKVFPFKTNSQEGLDKTAPQKLKAQKRNENNIT